MQIFNDQMFADLLTYLKVAPVTYQGYEK